MQFEFDGSQQPGSAVNLIPLTFNATLAAFLVAAGEYSYFSFSTKTKQLGAGFCGGPTPTWCYGMGWSDDFLRPLGGARLQKRRPRKLRENLWGVVRHPC